MDEARQAGREGKARGKEKLRHINRGAVDGV